MPPPPRALFGRRPCTSFVSPKAVTYLGLLRVAVASRDRQEPRPPGSGLRRPLPGGRGSPTRHTSPKPALTGE